MKKLFIFLFILAGIGAKGQYLINSYAFTSTAPSSGFYRAITVDPSKVPSDQSNFTFKFIGTYAFLKSVSNGGKVQDPQGDDITFSTDNAGVSLLSYKLVYWNATTGRIEADILLSTLHSGSADIFYLRYGSTTITTFQGGATGSEWDSRWNAVWHMDGSFTALAQTETDFTGRGNNLTTQGTWSSSNTVSGQLTFGIQVLSGNGNYFDIGGGAATFPSSTDFMLSAWVKLDAAADNTSVMAGSSSVSINWFGGDCRYFDGGGDWFASGTPVSTGAWHYYVISRSGGTVTLFQDGVSVGVGTFRTAAVTFTQLAKAFGTPSATETFDEVKTQIGTAAATGFPLAEYNNQSSPSTFYSVGAEN